MKVIKDSNDKISEHLKANEYHDEMGDQIDLNRSIDVTNRLYQNDQEDRKYKETYEYQAREVDKIQEQLEMDYNSVHFASKDETLAK